MQEREKDKAEGSLSRRTSISNAQAISEVTTIALNRGLTMVYSLIEKLFLDLAVPDSVKKIRMEVQELRHAFEHIDDRSEGMVNMPGKLDLDALSVFHQPVFIESSVHHYIEHSQLQ